MKRSVSIGFLAILTALVTTGCGDDTGGGGGGGGGEATSATTATTDASSTSTGTSGGGCADLCTGAGYTYGEETDFGGGLVECVCSGDGDGVAKADCETYCATFDVAANDALLSENAEPNDKCVCDGTT